ncbi:MAG: hypothetical protein L6408_05400 [Nanoarchaeota archaeon]|nr:hypothetical protein [Nanoarchaeota archaeon]
MQTTILSSGEVELILDDENKVIEVFSAGVSQGVVPLPPDLRDGDIIKWLKKNETTGLHIVNILNEKEKRERKWKRLSVGLAIWGGLSSFLALLLMFC